MKAPDQNKIEDNLRCERRVDATEKLRDKYFKAANLLGEAYDNLDGY